MKEEKHWVGGYDVVKDLKERLWESENKRLLWRRRYKDEVNKSKDLFVTLGLICTGAILTFFLVTFEL